MTKTLDIKILRVIHLLVTCGSVTKTADILNLSPGAVSYLLNKARKCTNTALFSRTREGMIPDNIAKELSERYLKISQELYDEPETVSLTKRATTISTYSLVELLLSEELTSNNPDNEQLHFTPPEMSDKDRLMRLRSKETDVDIGTRLPGDRSIVQTMLFSSGISILASRNNPIAHGPLTVPTWLNSRHIRWSRRMDFICNDFNHANRFYDLMNERNISVVSSDSLNMVLLCAFTDHVMLMPTAIAKVCERKLPIIAIPPPPELEMQFECYLHYHHSRASETKFVESIDRIQKYFKSLT